MARDRYCPDCKVEVPEHKVADHCWLFHEGRPDMTCLSLEEAGQVLHRSKGRINHLVRTGRLEVLSVPPRKWVTMAALTACARILIKQDTIKAARELLG